MGKPAKVKPRKKPSRRDGMTAEQIIALLRTRPEPPGGRAKTWLVVPMPQ